MRERIVLQHLGRFEQHIARVLRHPATARYGRSILLRDRFVQLVLLGDDGFVHALEHVDALALVGAGERGKRALCGGDRIARVLRIGETRAPDYLLGRRIVEVEQFVAVRCNERAVDIDFVDDLHGCSQKTFQTTKDRSDALR